MLRIILVAIVALLAAAGGLALVLNHYFGWKGLLAFPVFLLLLVLLGKLIIGRIFKHFVLGLIGRKAHVLRKASMTVHSIVPISKPAAQEIEADEDEAGDDPQDEPAAEEPGVYYEIDVTITPRGGNDATVWEPGELILTSQPIATLEGLEEHEVGTTYECLLWNGSVFVEDEAGKHPGEQRLKLTVEIKPGTREAWLQYYQEKIGRLELPEWRPSAAKEV